MTNVCARRPSGRCWAGGVTKRDGTATFKQSSDKFLCEDLGPPLDYAESFTHPAVHYRGG